MKNGQHTTKREQVMNTVMKVTGAVGVLALLALIAYSAMNFFHVEPKIAARVRSGAEAAVITVTSVFTPDAEKEAGENTEEAPVPTDTATSTVDMTPKEEAAPKEISNTPQHATPVTAAPAPIITRVSVDRGPADLAIEISATGALTDIKGKSEFIALSPIPSDRVGAARFVVSNLGSQESDTWKFTAKVPTKNDPDYSYTSKTQKRLKGGGKIEFTLGFDELPRSGSGKIVITLAPNGEDAKSGNNQDSETIRFTR